MGLDAIHEDWAQEGLFMRLSVFGHSPYGDAQKHCQHGPHSDSIELCRCQLPGLDSIFLTAILRSMFAWPEYSSRGLESPVDSSWLVAARPLQSVLPSITYHRHALSRFETADKPRDAWLSHALDCGSALLVFGIEEALGSTILPTDF